MQYFSTKATTRPKTNCIWRILLQEVNYFYCSQDGDSLTKVQVLDLETFCNKYQTLPNKNLGGANI